LFGKAIECIIVVNYTKLVARSSCEQYCYFLRDELPFAIKPAFLGNPINGTDQREGGIQDFGSRPPHGQSRRFFSKPSLLAWNIIKHSSSADPRRSTCLRLIFLEELRGRKGDETFLAPKGQIRAVIVKLLMECFIVKGGQCLHVEDGDHTFCCQMFWVQTCWIRKNKPHEMF
jgi:hypothetical protein